MLEEDFVDALVGLARSLPLGDIWQAAPAPPPPPPPQRRAAAAGAAALPMPGELALQVPPNE